MRLHRHFSANEEQLDAFPFKRELSMESYLVENEGILSLDSEIYTDVTIIQDELTLKQGRPSNDTDGRIDVLATYASEHIAIIELKLGELNDLHLRQLEDYLLQKSQILDQFPDILDTSAAPQAKWIGVIVGSSIAPELAKKMNDGYVTPEGVPIAGLTMQRFKGANGGVYVITDVFFRNNNNTRDNTQYDFDGRAYGKGRLAQAIVKKYVAGHPDITYSQLESVFYARLQGSNGVFSTASHADEVFTNTNRARHFRKPEDLITLSDSVIAVSSQWGAGNIDAMINKARELGYTIT